VFRLFDYDYSTYHDCFTYAFLQSKVVESDGNPMRLCSLKEIETSSCSRG
jgi:hypothetical protein